MVVIQSLQTDNGSILTKHSKENLSQAYKQFIEELEALNDTYDDIAKRLVLEQRKQGFEFILLLTGNQIMFRGEK
ncbi:hypothetical protein QS257_09610 [Terrilactibacillus sp. S3-3]|nr:hypothetical protein QS257_09610 [Terrilactibacillus sp. S3-3]